MNNKLESIKKNTIYKKTYGVVFIFMMSLFLSACFVHDLSTGPEDDHIRIKGSGIMISEELDLTHFKSIAVNTAGLVTIASGTEQYTEVTVDNNIFQYLRIYVENEILVIEIVEDVSLSNYDLTIDITMTELRSLTTNSAGNIEGLNTFEEDQINLIVNSAGNITLDMNVNQLNSMINSAGNLILSGQTIHHNGVLSSAGNLSAFGLEAETTTLLLNSAGSAHVTVTKLLDVTINSAGCVFYKGDPQIIQTINSIGCVISAN